MNERVPAGRSERTPELKVFISTRDSTCDECGQELGGCPPHRAEEIAVHACRKHGDRVGRSAAAKRFDPQSIELAVLAHLRHTETRYDDLLARGVPRHEARQRTHDAADRVLERWRRQAEPRA